MREDRRVQSLSLRARLTRFEGSHEVEHVLVDLPEAGGGPLTCAFAGASWEVVTDVKPVAERPDALDGAVTFRVLSGVTREVAVALEWCVTPWSRDVFVMLPAAAYNGNRYPCRPYSYPPMVREPADCGPEAPVLVTNVPRLNAEDGKPSRLQLLTGDLTTPCISFRNPATGIAAILLTEQGGPLGNHGLTVEESLDRKAAVLRIEAPGVRRDTLYTMLNPATPSWDRGAEWPEGRTVTLPFRLFRFPAPTVQALYDRFAEIRKDLSGPVVFRHELPLTAGFRIVEEKYRRDNWCAAGYYHVSPREVAAKSPYGDWQLGWVGGGMALVPLLMRGGAESRRCAVRNLEWMFGQAQLPSGLFHAIAKNGVPQGDGFGVPGTERWYMVRKQADALYFLIKAFHVLRAQDPGWQLPAAWAAGTQRLAEVFVRVFRRHGQLGQYLDCETGELVVGGSTAAAMAPGALAAAGEYLSRKEYVDVAEALAAHLDERDVRAGITVGGPGEILKCADSESAFAMLESFVVLYEVTGRRYWLERAEAMATQCMTWCASYDYVFPPGSWFGRLGMRAAGSVWANVQNKHSAPGICTLSGDSLFKLFRYTGEARYLDLIQEIAHNLPQYISRADRPVGDPKFMRPGFICERVNFSDWEGRDHIGGSLLGSCWPEVSLLLTAAELPGIYVQPDTGKLCVFDNLEARLVAADRETVTLECHNPTAFDTEVLIFVEASTAAGVVLGQAAGLRWPAFSLRAGERRTLQVPGCR